MDRKKPSPPTDTALNMGGGGWGGGQVPRGSAKGIEVGLGGQTYCVKKGSKKKNFKRNLFQKEAPEVVKRKTYK